MVKKMRNNLPKYVLFIIKLDEMRLSKHGREDTERNNKKGRKGGGGRDRGREEESEN